MIQSDDWVGVLIFIGIVAMFTDLFGLGSLWTNRGSWYTIIGDEELQTVLDRLHTLGAFYDSDGIVDSEYVKVKVYISNREGSRYYRVKIPDWVFRYAQVKLTDEAKMKILGLTVR
jgi:hypothetical protein